MLLRTDHTFFRRLLYLYIFVYDILLQFSYFALQFRYCYVVLSLGLFCRGVDNLFIFLIYLSHLYIF